MKYLRNEWTLTIWLSSIHIIYDKYLNTNVSIVEYTYNIMVKHCIYYYHQDTNFEDLEILYSGLMELSMKVCYNLLNRI